VKGTVRIIAGSMRGKAVPFINNKFGDADITPQKVKGAIFSMLGENLEGKIFVDLFAGSGQIGFEAASRGASQVIFNETDRTRFAFIREFAASSGVDKSAVILNMKAGAALTYLSGRGIKADIIFADPPYEKIKGAADSYVKIIEDIADSGTLSDNGIIVIQHYSANALPGLCSGFTRVSLKKYGTTSLSLFMSE